MFHVFNDPWWSQMWIISGKHEHEGNDGDLSLCGNDELAVWCVTRSNSCLWEDTTHKEFPVLPCRVKIQGLALIGCAWQWPCWRHCFASEDFLQGENLWSLIGQRRRLCIVAFLKALLLEWRTSGVVLVVSVSLLWGIVLCSGTFLFCNSFSFFLGYVHP